jgi:hypothetical protein
MLGSGSFGVTERLESLGLSAAEARKRLKRIGTNWAAYIKQMYRHDRR